MAKTGTPVREVHLEYAYDRLCWTKTAHVFQLLVPDPSWRTRKGAEKDPKDYYEGSGSLWAGVLGTAKRKANHR